MYFFPDMCQLMKGENYLILDCSVCGKRYSKWDEVSRIPPPYKSNHIVDFLCLGAARVGGFLGLEPVGVPPGWAEKGLASLHLWQWDVPWEQVI